MRFELATQPAATTFDLADLVGEIYEGRVRIPHFQRGFRWEARDVRRLFDSILKGYPIGSLLMWRRAAPKDRVQLGALTIDAPDLQSALWVVDGQQRITSIANVLRDEGQLDARFALVYDLSRGELLPPTNADQSTSIPLPVLFDLRRLLGWFNQHPELSDLVEDANDIATRLRRFAIPAYVVDSADVQVLQDIFDRMNNYGKRLSRAEVFSALFAPDEQDAGEALTIRGLAEYIDDELGFGRIDDDTVLRVILARRGSDVAREIRIEFDEDRRKPSEFPKETRDDAFAAGKSALSWAVQFLRSEAGIPHFSLLPYRYLLVVVARFLAHFPDAHPRNRALLRRWLWRAAVVGPEIFRGSATGAIRALCSRITPGMESNSIQELLAAVEHTRHFAPNLARFRTNEASTRIVLCALWSLNPRSLTTGEPFNRHQLADTLKGQDSARDVARQMIPRRAVSTERRPWAANRLLLMSEDEPVDELVDRITRKVVFPDPEIWPKVLRSHVLDSTCVEFLLADRIKAFLDRRQEMMQEVTNAFIERVCEWNLEDTPPLAELELDDEPGRDDLHEVEDASA